jgi:predicted TIM-barrel fold metal-dependent hydrolase
MMQRLDINACFGHWPYWDLYHKAVDDLLRLMDRNGIERAACMSLRSLFIDWRQGNSETLAAAAEHADRLIPAVTISPFLGGDGRELDRLLDGGAKMIRLYPTFHSFRLDDAFVDDICAAAGDRGVPVMIPTRPMMNWRFAAVPLEAIGPVVERHPSTRFVMSGPNYLIEYQALVRVMKRCANVWYEISCLQGFNSVVNLVNAVGADRILFGTGALLNYPACNVAKLDHAGISDQHRKAIASGNATKLLTL